LAIAVVVLPVADLVGAGIDADAPVIAVVRETGARSDSRVAIVVGVGRQTFIGLTIAVVVRAVAGLGRPGMDGGVCVVAVPPARRVAVAVSVEALVDRAVAVVVHAVAAHFSGARVDGGVGIIAIVLGEGPALTNWIARYYGAPRSTVAVAIVVLVPDRGVWRGLCPNSLVGHAVAVVVHAVAHLGRPGVSRGIEVIAVAADRRITGGLAAADEWGAWISSPPVPISILIPDGEDVIDLTIAVVVEAVAGLGRARVDPEVGVVAVAVILGVSVAVVVGDNRRRLLRGRCDRGRRSGARRRLRAVSVTRGWRFLRGRAFAQWGEARIVDSDVRAPPKGKPDDRRNGGHKFFHDTSVVVGTGRDLSLPQTKKTKKHRKERRNYNKKKKNVKKKPFYCWDK